MAARLSPRPGAVSTASQSTPASLTIRCPHLGMLWDRGVSAMTSSDEHRCYARKRSEGIATEHQEMFCLTAGFRQCKVFDGQALPQSAARRSESRGVPSFPVLLLALPLVAFVLGAILAFVL